ncbi:MAG TPA: S41 family peptidase [Myxococcales bacterium]|nr:S41 family peptidase [Myxococcales bacterium]
MPFPPPPDRGSNPAPGRSPLGRLLLGAALALCAVLGGLGAAAAGRAAGDPAGPYKKLDVFSHVLSLIENLYVENVDETRLLYGAIDGMVRTLDPHSSFMEPRSYAALKEETDGEYGGVGLELTLRDGEVVVVSPLDDTPASHAGFAPGDRIVEIDGQPMRGLKESDAAHALTGPPGTTCVVKALRDGWEAPRAFTLVRDVIRVVSVEDRLYDHKYGYVKLKSFSERTDTYLKKALDQLRAQSGGELKGLVLDLRRNPGGLLDQAVKVADRFLRSGIIVTTKGRGGRHVEVERAHARDTEPGYPLVVLVDGGTASASEIVAGALQDHGRGLILGTQTFGKGSVQQVIELDDGSGLKLTTARYYTPSGKSIQERGISPDLLVRASKTAGPDEDAVREKGLPNHFHGEGEDAKVDASLASSAPPPLPSLPKAPGDPDDDRQLKAALDALRTWPAVRLQLKERGRNSASATP